MADIRKVDFVGLKDDELLSRWLDGELDAGLSASLEHRLTLEPELADKLRAFEHNDSALRAMYRRSAQAPSPALSARILASDLPRVDTNPKTGWRNMAIAASMTLAVALGLVLQGQGPADALAMDPLLADALETIPSRAEGWDTLEDGRELRAVLTFPAADGAWCREFMTATEEGHWRGVACRHEGSWVTQVIGREVFLEQSQGYQAASAQDSNAIARFIDATATDVALSLAQEQSLLSTSWTQ